MHLFSCQSSSYVEAFGFFQIENSTHKLKEEAERNLITLMEDEEKLRSKIVNKKRQCLHLEKQQQLNDLLDLQVTFINVNLFSVSIL